ncbi:MAG: dTDP-4-dehydrorhamnose 3,5-epimerase [Flavobacteriaceae bacterium]|jgi:dTDP-4-dehydrorhamnose 3,5-epimerase|nr:dTDP-4-dehydrorhamnose 3,5-epimerase [Flavobacteriaceae bacterium]MBT3920036.1 dTDP-4-dehydrorhamnose 3,5-epimerase [Flavobacteriaceae bacterium]MBT7896275.1 dTDP-4-dehydrorhamnose 3,5-epimerase [Flavobacteriales bacterium]
MSNINHFKFEKSKKIDGVYVFTPSFGKDNRGIIYTSFYEDNFNEFLPKNLKFKHDKFSSSKKSVLRGIHGDVKSWKLITCVYGEIYQVVVDCREDSPTYKQWEAFTINSNSPQMILLPPKMGNSFFVNSETAIYHYKLAYEGEYLDAEDQFSLKWNDSSLGIEWPIEHPILSNRDK